MTEKNLQIYQPMRYRVLFFLISLLVIVPGTYSLFSSGLKQGIDFTGGTRIVWQSDVLNDQLLQETAAQSQIDLTEIKNDGQIWSLTTSPINREEYQTFLGAIRRDRVVDELSFDTIGPSLGAELLRKTMYGLSLAAGLILLYVAYRFQDFSFGMSAILAMLHDLLVVLGIFSLLKLEVDTLFVTALLTILSFSVHDTIVVYDRIRELKKKHGGLPFEELTNRAVVETMSRSINNSMTIIFMLLAMYLMGGDTTRNFIFALLVGTISGTYSSTFTAAPLLVVWENLAHSLKLRKYKKK